MTKRNTEIKPIENKAKRHTAFTKRRNSLMKKTMEFCNESNSEAAMIAFSKAGNCFVHGHPHIDTVLDRYEAECPSSRVGEAETSGVREGVQEEEAPPPLSEMQKRIGGAIRDGRWDEAVRGLGYQELVEFVAELQHVIRMVREARIAAEERERVAAEERETLAAEE